MAAHRSMNDCWIIVHGKVYDVTQFIQQHPGGSRVFMDWAGTGKDSAKEFDYAMHGAVAMNKMKQYYIGVLN